MAATNKLALVTGASRGIGRQVALDLAAAGCDIAFCYAANDAAAEETKREIESRERRCFAARCDVKDHAAVGAFIAAAKDALGGPFRILVNNAGIIRDNPLAMMKPEQWDEVIRTNLDSVFHFSRHLAFDFIKAKQGRIITISSVSGVYGNPTQTNYSAAKAAMIGFSKALAKEVGPYGINVNVVAPGFIATDMTDGLEPKAKTALLGKIALRRLGTPKDVSSLVGFLASDDAAYITGQVFGVDGGIVI
jgi:3-oxoacyl-[acyl-carrier protein] reductase